MKRDKTMAEATPEEAHEALNRIGNHISDADFKHMVYAASTGKKWWPGINK